MMLYNTQRRCVFLLFISAIIGPPNVTLLSVGTAIEVSIRNPKFAISTLKDVYSFHTYNVTYWKDGKMDQVT